MRCGERESCDHEQLVYATVGESEMESRRLWGASVLRVMVRCVIMFGITMD